MSTWVHNTSYVLFNLTSGPQHPGVRIYLLITMSILPVVTVIGNVLVVISIYQTKSLRTVTNHYIVSLAVADISLGGFIMPLSLWVEANHNHWYYPDTFCDIYVMLDAMLCTSSILNLVAISIDRHVAVTRPIEYCQQRKFLYVNLKLVLVWSLSFAIALPIVCGMNTTPDRHMEQNVCRFFNADFLIYSSLGSFYIPCIIMVILYWRIFQVLRKRVLTKKRVQGSELSQYESRSMVTKTYDMYKHSSNGSLRTKHSGTISFKKSRLSQRVESVKCYENVVATDDLAAGVFIPKTITKSTVCFIDSEDHYIQQQQHSMDDFVIENNHHSRECCKHIMDDDCNDAGFDDEPIFETWEEFRKHLKKRLIATQKGLVYYGQPYSTKVNNVNKNSPVQISFQKIKTLYKLKAIKKLPDVAGRKERISARKERKATKTLAIVLGVFLICWTPFFAVNMVSAMCMKIPTWSHIFLCSIPDYVMSVTVWLGYINSTLNPFIYTIFNMEFRKAFSRLICNH